MTIEIIDESYAGLEIHQLYIDGGRAVAAIRRPGQPVELSWQVYGPQFWPDAQKIIQGLVQLSFIADQMHSTGRVSNAGKKTRAKRK